MIVYSDKSFIRMSDYPDTDWKGDADWVLNDNDPKDSELENKIISLYPNFDFVIDAENNITDIIETEHEPAETVLEITDKQRISALEDAMEAVINILMEE